MKYYIALIQTFENGNPYCYLRTVKAESEKHVLTIVKAFPFTGLKEVNVLEWDKPKYNYCCLVERGNNAYPCILPFENFASDFKTKRERNIAVAKFLLMHNDRLISGVYHKDEILLNWVTGNYDG